MNTHDCLTGLAYCPRHPRWKVVRDWTPHATVEKPWSVYTPGTKWIRSHLADTFPTHADAVWYARMRALDAQVAAIQDGAA